MLPPLTGGAIEQTKGRETLNDWVRAINSLIADLNFEFDVGPISDGPYLVVRWKATGTYAGGLPGTSAESVGRSVTFYGTDTLRVQDGQLAEYWVNADSLWFLQQLGLTRVPPLS